jgi:hypothetical protein
MTRATNAQALSTVLIFETFPTARWYLDLGNPHLDVDGDPMTGSFTAWVPPSYFEALGTTASAALAAGLDVTRTDGGIESTLAATITLLDGGTLVRVDSVSYSTPRITVAESAGGSGDAGAGEPDAGGSGSGTGDAGPSGGDAGPGDAGPSGGSGGNDDGSGAGGAAGNLGSGGSAGAASDGANDVPANSPDEPAASNDGSSSETTESPNDTASGGASEASDVAGNAGAGEPRAPMVTSSKPAKHGGCALGRQPGAFSQLSVAALLTLLAGRRRARRR